MNNFWDSLPQPFFVLAPMEAVTDVVFRHVVARAGAPDVWFTEFTNATGWAAAGDPAIGTRLVKTDDEQPIVAQLWGAVPDAMEKLAAHCVTLGYHGIDINMGCPDKSATKSGGGSAMICNPENAAAMIAAAKTSGLPVSVKTRLGYSRVDEWRDWLTHILKQDVVNLTIHLRTKKEMSKVPAHFELIPEIVALRDEIAPHTKLTINGDIKNRAEGEALAAQHPGVNGIMIGRGIFSDPFAFAKTEVTQSIDNLFLETSAARDSTDDGSRSESRSEAVSQNTIDTKTKTEVANPSSKKQILLDLLRYQLDLHDQWDTTEHPRKFDPLKRFFKIYVRDFDGAAELRDKLMHTRTTAEVRSLLDLQC